MALTIHNGTLLRLDIIKEPMFDISLLINLYTWPGADTGFQWGGGQDFLGTKNS